METVSCIYRDLFRLGYLIMFEHEECCSNKSKNVEITKCFALSVPHHEAIRFSLKCFGDVCGQHNFESLFMFQSHHQIRKHGPIDVKE